MQIIIKHSVCVWTHISSDLVGSSLYCFLLCPTFTTLGRVNWLVCIYFGYNVIILEGLIKLFKNIYTNLTSLYWHWVWSLPGCWSSSVVQSGSQHGDCVSISLMNLRMTLMSALSEIETGLTLTSSPTHKTSAQNVESQVFTPNTTCLLYIEH